MSRLALLVCLCLAAGGCYAFALPPSRTDIGSTVHNPGSGPASGMRVSTGVHSASAYHKGRPKTDVGAGYVYERTDPGATAMGETSLSIDESDDVDEAHGAYLELSRTVSSGRAHRAWLGLRSELLWHEPEIGPAQRSLGISTRLSWELYNGSAGSGSKDTRCGFVTGIWQGASAIGLFVETGARAVEGAPTEMVATAGVSVRLPIVMGVGMDLCSW